MRVRPVRVQAARAAAGLVALVCATSACRDASQRATARANVILISIDTLRADRLGSYGYDRPTSPAIDRLASRGVRFAHAIAESSWTLPSHMTLMTGLYPTSHGVTAYKPQSLREQTPLLAQVVRKAGYRCYGFTGGGFVDEAWGFGRGFEEYEELPYHGRLDSVLASAKERIATLSPEARYFLFLHTYDVHSPYDPPERYALMFRTRSEGDYLHTTLQPDQLNRMKLTSGQVRFISDQYDADIRAADDQLGDFFAWLEQRGAFRDTIVILLSDHGEELGEHGSIGHGSTLYMEVLRIPLIVVAPGITPRVVREPVGLVDVMPTVLDMLGLAPPPMEGRSLLPLLRAETAGDEERPLFSELTSTLRSVVSGTYHLISDPKGASPRLFDLRRDPMERQSLPMTGEGEKLNEVLRAHLVSLAPPNEPGRAIISAAVAERLRALGYAKEAKDRGGAAMTGDLMRAAGAGDTAAVVALLAAGADVNGIDRQGASALVRAAEGGYQEVVEALLARGARADTPGWTPLIAAAANGRTAVLATLLAHSVDPNAVDWAGAGALQRAAENGHVEAIELLLAGGAAPQARDQQGVTPLIAAAANGHAAAALSLLGRGVDPGARALIAGGAEVNAKSVDGSTALLAAASKGAVEMVELLLAHGADVNAKRKDGTTALHVAIEDENKKLIEVLLAHGADVNAKTEDGTTALHMAIEEENTRLIKVLLAHGADLDAMDSQEESPRTLADDSDSPAIVQLLDEAAKARQSARPAGVGGTM